MYEINNKNLTSLQMFTMLTYSIGKNQSNPGGSNDLPIPKQDG
jgi:hypothetical protein